jgi:translocator protein
MIPRSPFYVALIVAAAFYVGLAIAGGLLTQLSPWYYNLKQPAWKPPDWAFGPIWTSIFICLTVAIAYAWDAANLQQRTAMLWAIGVNGLLNMIWSYIFFIRRNPRLAFVELVVFWLSILAMLVALGSVSRLAGYLVLPYIAWVTTAGVLNFQIVRLNRV